MCFWSFEFDILILFACLPTRQGILMLVICNFLTFFFQNFYKQIFRRNFVCIFFRIEFFLILASEKN